MAVLMCGFWTLDKWTPGNCPHTCRQDFDPGTCHPTRILAGDTTYEWKCCCEGLLSNTVQAKNACSMYKCLYIALVQL
jgi:hypothetical protein